MIRSDRDCTIDGGMVMTTMFLVWAGFANRCGYDLSDGGSDAVVNSRWNDVVWSRGEGEGCDDDG